MNGNKIVSALPGAGVSAASFGWSHRAAPRLIRLATRNLPQPLADRLEEEWLADLAEQCGGMSRLKFALGCYWAATVVSFDDYCTGKVPAASSATECRTMTAYTGPGPPTLSRLTIPVTSGSVMSDINITPLIDVMLVLLVTLIISLPMMTHAVKLDLSQAPPSRETIRPEVIDLDIDADGTVVWNGTAIASLRQLESYLRTEALKNPQPEIHLRPDARVKYDVVAKVLALAQHNRMAKMAVANAAEFKD